MHYLARRVSKHFGYVQCKYFGSYRTRFTTKHTPFVSAVYRLVYSCQKLLKVSEIHISLKTSRDRPLLSYNSRIETCLQIHYKVEYVCYSKKSVLSPANTSSRCFKTHCTFQFCDHISNTRESRNICSLYNFPVYNEFVA